MQFLRYAIASNGELKVGYYAADGRACPMPAETADLIALNERIARMLNRWQDFDHYVSVIDLLFMTGKDAPRYLKHASVEAGEAEHWQRVRSSSSARDRSRK